MKKIILTVIVASTFISCKKDRVCSCTYSNGSLYSQSTYINVTRKEAKNLCVTSAQGINCTVQ